MRNHVLLIALTLAAWLCFKAIDYFVSGPAILLLLSFVATFMVAHSLWMLTAQRRWRRDGRRRMPKPLLKKVIDNPESQILTIEPEHWRPTVDIFVPAKNEARVIEETVRNLFKLDYPVFDVWVIDDGSTDETPQILSRLIEEFPRFHVHSRGSGSVPGKSAALNEVLPISKGQVVAVFDADAYVAPDFLKLMLPLLCPEGIGAVQAQKKLFQSKGFLVNCQASEYALDTYFQVGRDLIGGAVELRGNGQIVKREALIDVGGWNNKAITDDLDLTMRLLVSNWDVRFCPHALVWEEGVPTLKGLIRQRRRWAEGSIRRYLDYIFPLNSPTRLSLVERIDTLAFFTFFAVPLLICLEVASEAVHFATGGPTHASFLFLVVAAVLIISQLNFFVAIRYWRQELTWWQVLQYGLEVNAYTYVLWLPSILFSMNQILFRRGASKWHRTEHMGHTA